jgi:ribosomal subunit interface protein
LELPPRICYNDCNNLILFEQHMRIEFKYTRIEPNADIEAYANKRLGTLSRFLKKFEHEGELTMFVELARTTQHHRHGNVHYAEVTIELPGTVLRAEHAAEDLKRALDRLKIKLKDEIGKYKAQHSWTRKP